jgi:hypothetical protein
MTEQQARVSAMLATASTRSPGEWRDSAVQQRSFCYPASMVALIPVGFGSYSLQSISSRNKGHARIQEGFRIEMTKKEKRGFWPK